jgi:hypothetical protein
MDVFEYAIIRLVPQVERGECINVGLIMYCRDQKFIRSQVNVDEGRLRCFSKEIDCDLVKLSLHSFELISKGEKEGGPIAQLDDASRFRWLTANRSTIVQCSKVHPGITEDANATFDKMFRELVL